MRNCNNRTVYQYNDASYNQSSYQHSIMTLRDTNAIVHHHDNKAVLSYSAMRT